MAKLLRPREEVKKAISGRIEAGNDLAAKADVAERTAGYRDWLFLFETWREETIGVLNTLYEGKDVGQEFGYATETSERSSPMYTFPYRKRALQYGVDKLQSLIERLELAVGESPNAISIESLHPEIYAKCRNLYKGGRLRRSCREEFQASSR